MIAQPFTYHAPASTEDVVDLLAAGDPSVVVLGGGTMLVPEMGHGRVVPSAIVDLARAGLAGIRMSDDIVVVGAMTTYSDVLASAEARTGAPLLTQVAGGITGGPQIRNRGTVGGSASFANPASDVPTCLVAAGAQVRLASRSGVRDVPADAFYLDAYTTARRPDEVLTEVLVPADSRARSGYAKFKTCESSWPIVTAGCVLQPDGDIRVAVGGASATPVLVEVDPPTDGVADPSWRRRTRDAVHAALEHPWTDVLASGSYRRQIAPAIVARAVSRALQHQLKEVP